MTTAACNKAFVAWWVVAGTLACTVGYCAISSLCATWEVIPSEFWHEVLAGTCIGALVGAVQAVLLRRRIRGAAWWPLASAAGCAAAGALNASLTGALRERLLGGTGGYCAVASAGSVFLVMGALQALPQALVLARSVARAWRWIPVGAVALAIGNLLGQWITTELNCLFYMIAMPVFAAATGAVQSCITGCGLAWLRAHRKDSSCDEY